VEKERSPRIKDGNGSKGRKVKQLNDMVMIWLHALQLLAQTQEGMKKLRRIESRIGEKWIKEHKIELPKKVETYDAAVSSGDIINSKFKGNDENIIYEVTKVGESITVNLRGYPLYTKTYTYTKRKNMKVFPFSTAVLITALKNMTERDFRSELDNFNSEEETVNLLPLEVGLTIIISLKLSKGTIRISEADAKELGLGLIDDVAIKHKKSGKNFSGMSYTSSKVGKGTVFLSVADARIIGYEEGEKVVVEKAGKDTEQAELVEVGEY
jgi:hypothetical protein